MADDDVVDWICDSCTFINSDLLPNCEVCGAPREEVNAGTAGEGQRLVGGDPIVLSDGDDGLAAQPSGSEDVIDLVGGNPGAGTSARRSGGAGPGPSSAAAATARGAERVRNRLAQLKRQPDPDITIIDDDDDGEGAVIDLAGGPTHGGPPSLGPAAAALRRTGTTSEPKRPCSAEEVYTLDACNCSIPLKVLAAKLRPAVAAALRTSAPAGASTAVAAAAAAAAPGTRGGTTLMDLAAPLRCPAPGCGQWLTSRDVRLLLGPYGTQALFYMLYAALRREGKAARAPAPAAQRDAAAAAATNSRKAASAPPANERSGGGRKLAGGAAAATDADACATGGGAAAGAAAATSGAPAPLPSLVPSCPGCRARMVPVSQLHRIPHQHTQVVPEPPPPSTQRPQRRQLARASARQASPPPAPAEGSPEGAGSAAAAATAAVAAQLRGALEARGRPVVPPYASLEHLCGLLRDAVGPRCAFLCLGCSRSLQEDDGQGQGEEDGGVALPRPRMQELQSVSEQALHALQLLWRLRAALLGAQQDAQEDDEEEEDDDEEEVDGKEEEDGRKAPASGAGPRGGLASAVAAAAGGGRGGGGRGGRGSRHRQSKQCTGGDRDKAWAKGVGYCGGGWYSSGGSYPRTSSAATVKAAQERQREADKGVRAGLRDLLAVISASGGGGGGPSLACSPPPVLHAALQYGGLPYVLRMLLQNDSLLDMGSRADLYRAALELVRCCMASMSLLELLVVPASDPRDTRRLTAPPPRQPPPPPPGTGVGAAAASTPVGPSASDPPMCVVFHSLRRQCAIFKRSAQELADGAEEDIAALGLALELGSLAEEVEAAVGMWRASMGEARGTLHALLQLPDGATASGHGAAATAVSDGSGGAAGDVDVPLAKRTRRGNGNAARPACGAAGGAAAAAAADAGVPPSIPGSAAGSVSDACRHSEYVSVMRPLQFREVRLMDDHYFRRDVKAPGSGSGGEVMRQRLKRITGEISGLATGLPLDWGAAAFVAVDDNRVDVLRALLIPSSDTPYANGAFIFDVLLPPEYPAVPPKVQFLTTGGGRVRFNPNLYADGKVCLSLLGTWSGPSWDPAMSTVLQVLVSIQSMILVSDPYYNEPGWEAQASTAAGRQAACDYADSQRYNTLAFSILPALQMLADKDKGSALSGGSTFRDVLGHHFRLKRPEILRQCDEWRVAVEARARPHVHALFPYVVANPSGEAGVQESSQEKLRKYTEQVLPQIKSILQSL